MIIPLVLVVTVFVAGFSTANVSNNGSKNHDSLGDRGNGRIQHLATCLLKHGKEGVWNHSVLVSTFADKGQLRHSLVSLSKLALLTVYKRDRDDEED